MTYTVWLIMSLIKLLYSNKVMMVIISIEMIMTSLVMLWLTNELFFDQCYFYIMFFCITVSEGVTGLSIIVSFLMLSNYQHSNIKIMKG